MHLSCFSFLLLQSQQPIQRHCVHQSVLLGTGVGATLPTAGASHNLKTVKMPWKKDSTPAENSATDSSSSTNFSTGTPSGTVADPDRDGGSSTAHKAFTPKKGRPTPKRNVVEREHGVRKTAFDAPTTSAEARKRRKELKNSLSKAEYKAMKQRQRDEAARARREASERMMAGDEQYLMERDKGPEKRLVRDWVDAHRYLMNFFLPMAFVVIIIMIVGTRSAAIANIASLFTMLVFGIMVAEGIWLGRKINRIVNERYPKNPHSKFALGMYAFTRATMIRKMRTPAPQKSIGDNV